MKTETQSSNSMYEIHFDSPMDMLDEKPSTVQGERVWGFSRDSIGPLNWAVVRSFDEFLSKVRTGWPELVDEVDRYASKLTFDPSIAAGMTNQVKRRRVRRDSGDELDFDEWRRGNVDTAWHTTERHVVSQRRIRAAVIDVNITALGSVTAQDMMWRTSLATLIARTLSQAGWSVEIISSSTSVGTYGGYDDMVTAITTVAKPSTMPLSIEQLALVTSPAWFRIAGFLARCSNGKKYEPNYSLGRSVNIVAPYVKRLEERGYLTINIANTVLSKASAQQALNEITEKIKEHAL